MKGTFSAIVLLLGCLLVVSCAVANKAVKVQNKRFAFVRNGDIWIANANGTNREKLTSMGPPSFANGFYFIDELSWSPGGGKIAIVTTDEGTDALLVYDFAKKKSSYDLIPGSMEGIDNINWLDENEIVFAGLRNPRTDSVWSSGIYLLNLTTKKITRLVKENAFEPSLSSDKRLLAYVSITKTGNDPSAPGAFIGYEKMNLYNINSKKEALIAKSRYYSDYSDARNFNHPRFSSDSKKIVVHTTGTDVSGGIFTYNLAGKKLAGFSSSSGNNYRAFGYAEFIDSSKIVYRSMTTTTPITYFLNVSRYSGKDNSIIGKGELSSIFSDQGFSVSADKGSILFDTLIRTGNKEKPGNVYLYDLKTRKTKLVARNATQPVWQR